MKDECHAQFSEKPWHANAAFSEKPLAPTGDRELDVFAAARRNAARRMALLREKWLRGANWFYWIAGLGILQFLLLRCGIQLHVGLGLTYVFDSGPGPPNIGVVMIIAFCFAGF